MRIFTLALFCLLFQSLFSQSPPYSVIEKYNAAPSKNAYWVLADYLSSFKQNDSIWAKKAVEMRTYFQKKNDERGIDYLDLCFATNWKEKGDFVKALNIAVPLLSKFKEHRDTTALLLTSRIIRLSYEFSKNYNEAKEFVRLDISIHMASKNKKEIANDYNDLGSMFAEELLPDSGLLYAQKSITIFTELKKESKNEINLSYPLGTIAENYIVKQDYGLAMPYLRRAIGEAVAVKDRWAQRALYNDFAKAFLGMKRYDSTNYYAYKSLSISLSTSFPENDQSQLLSSYECLRESFEKTGTQDSINKYFRLAIDLRDKLYGYEKTKAIQALSFQKLLEKTKSEQDRKDASIQAEMEKQKLIRNGFIGGFALMLLFAGVFFFQRNKIRMVNAELIVAKERAVQSEKFKQQFLANMSHEIRTPMNAVMGMTNILLEKKPSDDQRNYLDRIKKSSENLLVIINDILDLSKIEAGKMELEKIDFSLEETIEHVRQTLQFKAEEKGLELKINYDEKIPAVLKGDPIRLNQILVNLTGNAIKFTEKGSVTISVAQNPDSSFLFSISDTGIGMTQEQLQKLFGAFQQAESGTSRKYGGTGLGLSISQQLVELHGGKIKVESEYGKGTVFSFSIAYEVSENKTIAKTDSKLTTQMVEELAGIKILLAEDNEYNRIVANDILKLKIKNVVVDEAHNGKEAIDMLKQNNYNLVLMDAQMPVLDGLEATKKIRTELKNQIPILAMTASVMRTDLERCLKAGMNGYIPKPFRTSELLMEIYNVVREKSSGTSAKKETVPTNIQTSITDMTFLKEFCEGDEARMKKYISMYLNSAPKNLEIINQAMEKKDYSTVQKTVHQLKAHLRYIGMKHAAVTADLIEENCLNNKTEHLTLHVSELNNYCKASFAELS